MKSLALPLFLVISEDPSVRFWMRKHLSELFFVLEAIGGGEALEMIHRLMPAYVALDARSEEYDPFELCRAIRKIAPFEPILWITGDLKKASREAALEAGASDFLTHPLDTDELETRLAILKKGEQTRLKMSQLSCAIPSLEQGGALEGAVRVEKRGKFSLASIPLFATAKERKFPLALLLLEGAGEIAPKVRPLLPAEGVLLAMEGGRLLVIAPTTSLQAATLFAREVQQKVGDLWIALTLFLPEEASPSPAYERLVAKLEKKGGGETSRLLIAPFFKEKR